MISNPCSWHVDGSNSKKFIHEGGTQLFHFSPRSNGLSNIMDMNVIFFANDEQHALNILKRMFEFGIECTIEYLNEKQVKQIKAHTDALFIEQAKGRSERLIKYYDALLAGNIKLETVPTNQFFVVGWADNDTIS